MSGQVSGYPGRYQIEYIELTNFQDDVIDISDFVTRFSYLEDIFSPVIYGTVGISDSLDLHQYYPMCGEEKIRIGFRSAESEDLVELEFNVYKVGSKQRADNQRDVYVIHFCSSELVTNSRNKVSKSYKGQTVDEIVNDALDILESEKDRNIASTENLQHIISPRWSPLELISHCASIAKSGSYDGSNFVFYENKDGFTFDTIENLVSQPAFNEDPIEPKIQDKQENADSEEQINPSISFKTFVVERASKDTLKMNNDGMYLGKTISYDPLTHAIATTEFNHSEEFGNLAHLDRASVFSPNFSVDADTEEHKVTVHTTKTFREDSTYYTANEDENTYSTKEEEIINKRASQVSEINSIIVSGELYGYSDITCGQVLNINVPNNTILESVKTEAEHHYLTGNFLVRSCQHILEGNEYTIEIVLVKDSLKNDIERILPEGSKIV